MKKIVTFSVLMLSAALELFAQSSSRLPILFDKDWKFFRGGVERGQTTGINDSSWRTIDLPHDWSIEDLPHTHSPFDPDAVSQVGGGFTTGGTAWYRKTFIIPEEQKGKRIRIIFDGVYMNADVWLNGIQLGNHPYGYTSFYYDLTDNILFGEKNILAVQVKNEGSNSRWYSGSGIYRHVWLQYLEPVHLQQWGTHITCRNVSAANATLAISTAFENKSGKPSTVTVVSNIVDAKGVVVGTVKSSSTLSAGAAGQLKQTARLNKPALWSVDTPVRYTLVTELYAGDELKQHAETFFGIRDIRFDAAKGFLLNGIPVKLKGGCYHNDNGPLGAKSFDRAEERRVELLRASGFNAIRCSHNPPSPAFLDACDRLGMLVIDEAFDMWQDGKTPYDYHLYFNDWWKRDVENMVKRDMNHPSIILWSIGNEIPRREQKDVVETGIAIGKYIRGLDSTRPITAAVNDVKADKDPFFSMLGVSGYNYARKSYEEDHERVPSRIMMGTESYALEAFEYWMAVEDHPYVIGDFVWTGFDYIGEASIGWRGYEQEKGFYPWNLAYCGDIDICGWKRPQSYYRDALWKKDQLSVFVQPPVPSFPLNPKIESWSIWNWHDVVADWTWKGFENTPLEVSVYSSCEETELFLNGRSLGRKPTNRSTKFMAAWKVPYEAGTLKAIGYRNKKKVKESELVTAKEPAHITLTADRSSIRSGGQDLSYITVELKDADNHIHPKADQLIHFTIEGPGTIAGVGNANPVSLESYQGPQRKAWRGRCLVIIRSAGQPGAITLHASAEALGTANITIHSINE